MKQAIVEHQVDSQLIPSIAELPPYGRMFAVYAAYGEAMMAAHSLERRLGALLVARICERALSQSDHATALATHNRLPLGVLIERFIQEYVPPEDLVEELDNMLYFRNELTHRVSEQVVAACRTAKWEETFIAEMFEITTYFRETNDALRPYTTEWFLKNGLCESEVIEKAITLYPGVRGSDPIPSREP